jgi:hypothetical protein
MADPIYLVQGDTGPQIKVSFTRQDTDAAQDITNSTVAMHFRRKYSDTVLFSNTGQSTEAEALLGESIIVFTAGQLDIDAGEYEGEIEVVFNSGVRETIYEKIDFLVRKDFA